MKHITRERLFAELRRFQKQHGRMPTFKELQSVLHVGRTQLQRHLRSLAGQGLIAIGPRGTIPVTFTPVGRSPEGVAP